MPIFGVEMKIVQAKINTLTPLKNKIPNYTGCLKQGTVSSTHNEMAEHHRISPVLKKSKELKVQHYESIGAYSVFS